MGWNNENEVPKKEGIDTAYKLLIAIAFCVVVIIILTSVLLIKTQKETFIISVDGKDITTTTKKSLLTQIDGITYINIKEFSNLVAYEYHEGEYKAFTIEKDKCYVQGKEETATFYLNVNKVFKLPVNELNQEYREYTVEKSIKNYNNEIYAPIEAVSVAFNVQLEEGKNYFKIYTLDYYVAACNSIITQWGYTEITGQNFENKKAMLYGYIIVNKPNGLYKIIDDNNMEIVPDRYKAIQFTESTQEFSVTNSLGQVGIINLDGTNKIEPVYDSIAILDKKSDLYLVEKNKKFGVVKSGNKTIVFPEYDAIGVKNNNYTQYLVLDTLIPICKNNKWGAFDKNGNLVYKMEYDGFGCDLTTVEIDGMRKNVKPVLYIEKCNGVVVKKLDSYGLLDINGKELIPIAVSNIYGIEEIGSEDLKYFMLYNGTELNVIERLVKAGLINAEENEEIKNNDTENNTINNIKESDNENTSRENLINYNVNNSYSVNISNQGV